MHGFGAPLPWRHNPNYHDERERGGGANML